MQQQKKLQKPEVPPFNAYISHLLQQLHIFLCRSLWSILLS